MDSAKFGNIKQMINMKLSKGEDIDYESVKKDILNQAAELAIEEESRATNSINLEIHKAKHRKSFYCACKCRRCGNNHSHPTNKCFHLKKKKHDTTSNEAFKRNQQINCVKIGNSNVRFKQLNTHNLNWDDRMDDSLVQDVNDKRCALTVLSNVRLKRRLNENGEMFCFCDASFDSYGYVMYLDGDLIYGKSRVAPKPVARRLLSILTIGSNCNVRFRHISGRHNPTDLILRGCSPAQYMVQRIWKIDLLRLLKFAFENILIDVFGPLVLRNNQKAYGLMTVCRSTKATRIRVLENLRKDCLFEVLLNLWY
ncbi:hypothetical protein RDWZM_009880 [Blomia tropicalis]|uniref:Uncharacterized protein n=1 Tax=Blomia tropicalis TaxID=40697 RepID=A0A9Q0RII6_BLOTA|nr:hypothetical protein RDWZM_009874 [Blomia tropicalis]KAJ6215380.1 hypothetical protein RDWZM_009880 [Blomia tropicalis]